MPQLMRRPVVIVVRDGWGHNPYPEWNHANAVYLAKTPVNDRLLAQYPNVQIHTCGEDVGLPPGVMGNSEVGHQNIGAGRIVDQEIMRITRRIRDGSFFANPTMIEAFEHARRQRGQRAPDRTGQRWPRAQRPGTCVRDHRHVQTRRVPRRAVLCACDHRWTGHAAPRAGWALCSSSKRSCRRRGWVASRAWWGVITQWTATTAGTASNARMTCSRRARTPSRVPRCRRSEDYYDDPSEPSRTGDEFVRATTILPPGARHSPGKPGDCNPRARSRSSSNPVIRSSSSITAATARARSPKRSCCSDEKWQQVPNGGFRPRTKARKPLLRDDDRLRAGPARARDLRQARAAARHPRRVHQPAWGLRQFRCAETEKFPHVTFFFNDYREPPFAGEDRQIVPSPRDVTTYDKKPEMSAYEVTDEMLRRIASAAVRPDGAQLRQRRHGRATPACSPPRSRRSKRSMTCVGKVVEAVLAKGGARS